MSNTKIILIIMIIYGLSRFFFIKEEHSNYNESPKSLAEFKRGRGFVYSIFAIIGSLITLLYLILNWNSI